MPVHPARILPAASLAFFAAFLAAALLINPGLDISSLPDGPGLTIDESFNILQGIYLHRHWNNTDRCSLPRPSLNMCSKHPNFCLITRRWDGC